MKLWLIKKVIYILVKQVEILILEAKNILMRFKTNIEITDLLRLLVA